MKIIKENEFKDEIASGYTIVDFYADWCGPCKMLGPVLEEVAEENTDIKFVKVNVDEAMEVASKYGIMSIPNVIMFKDGEAVNRFVGMHSKDDVLDFIKANKK